MQRANNLTHPPFPGSAGSTEEDDSSSCRVFARPISTLVRATFRDLPYDCEGVIADDDRIVVKVALHPGRHGEGSGIDPAA